MGRRRIGPVRLNGGDTWTAAAAAADSATGGAAATGVLLDEDSLRSFEDLAWTRWANTRGEFDPAAPPVPAATVARLLRAAQAAPSGFNAQPYKMVAVQGDAAKGRLAGAMLGSNGRKVLNASFSVVFLADLESSRLLPRVVELAEATPFHGRAQSPRSLFLMRIYQRLFAGGHRFPPLRPLAFLAKKVGLGVGSHAFRVGT